MYTPASLTYIAPERCWFGRLFSFWDSKFLGALPGSSRCMIVQRLNDRPLFCAAFHAAKKL